MRPHHIGYVSSGLILWLLSGSLGAYAQITLDGTMGPRGAIQGPNYQIPAQYGQQRGGNLFHSFGQFNVYTGESATFSGPNSVQNIISRVTGGSSSSIDGTLRSTIPNANLFLLNPAGVLFGPNAKLDVSGSFHVSTADYLRLGENDRFYADPTKNSVLSVAPPSAFGFLGEHPAPITIQGSTLKVPVGKNISLIGGDIELTKELAISSNLFAPSGRINIASVASSGEVIPNNSSEPAGLKMDGFEKLGKIRLTRSVFPDDPKRWVPNIVTDGDPGGTIVIRGGQLTIDQGAIGSNSSSESTIDHPGVGIDIDVTGNIFLFGEISSVSYGAGRAGDVRIAANRLQVKGGQIPTQSGNGFLYLSNIGSRAFGAGNGGNIDITADSLLVENNAQIGTTAEATGSGSAGNITIQTGDLQILGDQKKAFIHTTTFSTGNAGALTITADKVLMRGGPGVTGLSTQANPTVRGSANGGDIRLNAKSLQVLDGAQISASLFSGSGHAGDIKIQADSIKIAGTDKDGFPAGIFASTAAGSTGDAGAITLDVGRLDLSGGGQIFSGTYGAGRGGDITLTARDTVIMSGINPSTTYPSGLVADTEPGSTGNAGNITLTTGSLSLTGGGGIITGTSGPGHGGNITLTARNTVTISGINPITNYPSGLKASAFQGSTGDAGNINLTTGSLSLTGGGQIFSGTFGAGRGGDITLTARDIVTISGINHYPSGLFAETESGSTGNAGNITLTTGSLSLTEGGQILSSTFGPGRGGTIGITARDAVTLETGSQISTSSYAPATGSAGTIQVQAPLVTITGGLLTSSSTGAGDAGAIDLTVDRLVLSNGGRVTTGTGDASAGLGGSGRGGDIRITARQSVTVAGRDAQGNAAGLFATSQAPASGDAGRIQVQAPVVEVQAGGTITSATEGTGNAGVIGLNVDRLIVNQGGVSTSTEGMGHGGDITVTARESVSLTGRSDSPDVPFGLQASSRTPTSGNAGNIAVTAPVITVSQGSEISSATQGTGNAGSVTLQGDRLTLSEGGQISTATAGSGRGGDIQLTARDTVGIAGQSGERAAGIVASAAAAGDAGVITINVPQLTLGTGGKVESATTSAGNAGSVSLQVDRLMLQQGGEISTSTGSQVPTAQGNRALLATSQTVSGRGGAITIAAREVVLDDGRITSDTHGAGDAGSIGLRAERLTLANGGSISTNTTAGQGRGGNIDITTAESITMTGRNESQASGIYARSRAPASGNAGNITLSTDRLTLNEGTTITAESEQTSGGNIVIDARDTRLSKNSTITSSVQGNEQSDGGNVTLTGDKLIVYQGGKLTARATQGRGGRITINENVFLYEAPRAIPDVLDASSQVAGNQGVVTINARDLNLNRTLVPLPATYLDASKLLSNRCTAPQAGGRSSFVVRGRGAVPPGPEGPAPASARECLPAIPVTAGPTPRTGGKQ